MRAECNEIAGARAFTNVHVSGSAKAQVNASVGLSRTPAECNFDIREVLRKIEESSQIDLGNYPIKRESLFNIVCASGTAKREVMAK